MSKFTTEVRFICESKSGLEESKGFNDIETIISNSVMHIFNFNFPIFDEEYRIPLEKKILRHYYTREISEETVGLWQLRLNQKLNEIMPYYNKLYESELLQFDPLRDVDLTTQHQKVDNGQASKDITSDDVINTSKQDVLSSTRNITDNETVTNEHSDDTELKNTHADTDTISSTTQNTHNDINTNSGTLTNIHNDENEKTTWDVYSDTPQGALTNVDSNAYLTNARKITENDTSHGGYTNTDSRTENNNGGYTDTTSSTNGNTGNYTNKTTNEGEFEEKKNRKEKDTYDSQNNSTENTTKDSSINEQATSKNTEDYLQKIIGKTAGKSYSKMLQEFRETFLNIDAMIIKDLSVCFFGLWE